MPGVTRAWRVVGRFFSSGGLWPLPEGVMAGLWQAMGDKSNDNLSGGYDDEGESSGEDALASALLEALGQGAMSPSPSPSSGSLLGPRHTNVGLDTTGLAESGPEVGGSSSSGGVLVELPEEAGPGEVNCPSCAAINPAHNRFCGTCGATLEDVSRQRRRKAQLEQRLDRQEIELDIQLVAINEDGSDGIQIPLRYTETIIGRSGDTRFPTDAFLSPKHSRLLVEDGKLFIEDLFSLNGTYVRIRDEVRLNPGDCFLMGRQVLRFERFEQTITPKARSADGTRYMGSPPPGGQYKILQVGIGGVYQNVYCLPESGAVLGREKGDIVFPRDRFMSSRHAQIYPRDDGHYYLVDLNSSNGTWVKIWDRYQLEDGDLIFLGQQLFRVEARGLRM